MRNKKVINNALLELKDNSIISNEQYVRSVEYFEKKKEKWNASTLFTAIGVLLIALSIITIFAINWSGIPKVIKAFIAFVPLIITSIMLYYTVEKKYKNMDLYTSIFAPVAILASNSLICQIFHLQTEIYEVIFTSLIMFLPIVYIIRNYLSILVYGVGVVIFSSIAASGNDVVELIKCILLSLPIIGYNIRGYLDNKSDKKNIMMWTINVILVTMLFFYKEILSGELFILYLYAVYFITKVLFKESKLNKLLNWIFIGLLFISCISSDIRIGGEIKLGIDALLVLILLIGGVYFSGSYKNKDEYFIMVFLLSSQLLNFDEGISFLLSNIIAVGLGIYKIYCGNKEGIYKDIKNGLLIILLIIFFRFINSDLSFTVKSIIFLVSGGCFILGANKLKKKLGGENNE